MTIAGNNPTNLRPLGAAQRWNGQTGSVDDLCVFTSPEYGIRAAAKNLRAYGWGGINTIRKIYNAWAPSGDGGNDPNAYARFVASKSGFGVDDVLNLDDQMTLIALIRGSTMQECGYAPGGSEWYPLDVFQTGVAMAFGASSPIAPPAPVETPTSDDLNDDPALTGA